MRSHAVRLPLTTHSKVTLFGFSCLNGPLLSAPWSIIQCPRGVLLFFRLKVSALFFVLFSLTLRQGPRACQGVRGTRTREDWRNGLTSCARLSKGACFHAVLVETDASNVCTARIRTSSPSMRSSGPIWCHLSSLALCRVIAWTLSSKTWSKSTRCIARFRVR